MRTEKSQRQLALLLAASSLSAQQMVSMLRDLQRVDPHRLVDDVLHIRRQFGVSAKPRAMLQANAGVESFMLDLERLFDGTPMSRREWAMQLSLLLQKEFGPDVPRYSPKSSIREWLAKLLENVGPSKVLHIATRMRNDFAHGRRDADWKLSP